MNIFLLNDTRIFIHYRYLPQEGGLPPEDHQVFLVHDMDKDCQLLMSQGLKIEIPLQEFYWGRSACLHDPDGRQIAIIQKGNHRSSNERVHG